ncbi:ATP-dependent nuclease [Bacillus sp. FSL W8-0848]|uniref:ATP-dependent nuclease n=1 Tax=Bacillus sp. FSL W8-0848 TaxID=2954634 RepID=UPI0030F9A43B
MLRTSEHQFKLVGKHNSEKDELSGLKMRISPNDDYASEIAETLSHSEVFPFDYYKVEFKTFDGGSYTSYNRYLRYATIDSAKVNSKHATQKFIEDYYKRVKKSEERAKLQHQFRERSHQFSKELLRSEENSEYQLKLNAHKGKALEESLTIQKKDIDIANLGRGDSMFFNIDFALSRTKQDTNIILIEEPENHLSYLNMHRLIKKVDETEEKQIFIATHSNMIATRLDLQNAIFLGDGKSTKLNDLDEETSHFFQKSPDNNVLNFILSNKVILVEGNTEYILLDSFYKKYIGKEMYEDGIAMISVGGLSFKRYLKIAQKINKKVAVITDNDRDYRKNIEESYREYVSDNIKVFANKESQEYTLEVSIYKHNEAFLDKHLKNDQMRNGVLSYMLSNKAEAAFRILRLLEKCELDKEFEIPSHIKEAYKWIRL